MLSSERTSRESLKRDHPLSTGMTLQFLNGWLKCDLGSGAEESTAPSVQGR
jgi:hypothetical protein